MPKPPKDIDWDHPNNTWYVLHATCKHPRDRIETVKLLLEEAKRLLTLPEQPR